MDILCDEFVAVVTAVRPEMILEGRSLLKQKRLVLKPVELSRTNRTVLVSVIPKTLVSWISSFSWRMEASLR